MKRSPAVVLPLALLLAALAGPACSAKPPEPPGPKGHLFIVGGGDRDEPLMRRFVEMAEAPGGGRIVIFTMASGVPLEVGPELVAEFRGYGVEDVTYYQLTREEASRAESAALLDGAAAVWFAGGDQSRLTAVLLDTPLHIRLLEFYAAGGLVGGTSAGAAVLSEVMITGDTTRPVEEGREWSTIEAGLIVHTRGLGFIRNAVIDQHFLARRRQNRLISLVLEKPDLVGAGIDEATAVLVRPDGRWEVLGASQVFIVDARRARIAKDAAGRLGASGLALHLLLAGDVYDPATGRVTAIEERP